MGLLDQFPCRLTQHWIHIIYLTVAQERHELGRISHRHGKIHVQLVLLVEPERIPDQLVGTVYHHVPDPVHIRPFHHFRMNLPQRESFRVNVHFPVEDRRGHAPAGMEPDFPSLSSVNVEAVHQIIIIVNTSVGRQRRRNLHIEGIDEIVVEIRLQVHAAGKLRNGIVLIETGNPRRLYGFLADIRRNAVVALGPRVRNHHRKKRLAGNHRRVHIVEDEAEVPAYHTVAQVAVRICQVQFHLGVDVAGIGITAFRVIDLLALIDLLQNPFHIAVVRLYHCRIERRSDRMEPEIHLAECPAAHSYHLSLIS